MKFSRAMLPAAIAVYLFGLIMALVTVGWGTIFTVHVAALVVCWVLWLVSRGREPDVR